MNYRTASGAVSRRNTPHHDRVAAVRMPSRRCSSASPGVPRTPNQYRSWGGVICLQLRRSVGGKQIKSVIPAGIGVKIDQRWPPVDFIWIYGKLPRSKK